MQSNLCNPSDGFYLLNLQYFDKLISYQNKAVETLSKLDGMIRQDLCTVN